MASGGAATGGAGTATSGEDDEIKKILKDGGLLPINSFWRYYTMNVGTKDSKTYKSDDGSERLIHISKKWIFNVKINRTGELKPVLGTIFGFQEFGTSVLAVRVEDGTKTNIIPISSIETIEFGFKPSNMKGGRRRKTRRHRHRNNPSRRQTQQSRRQSRHIFTPVSSVL